MSAEPRAGCAVDSDGRITFDLPTTSADGRRFAILREGAIEVYNLPAVVAAPTTGKKK